MSVTVRIAQPVPIPVGHRVELTWYLKPGGLRARAGAPAPQAPSVLDRDSGIRYAAEWQLGRFGTFRSDRVNDYPTEPLADLPVERTLRGTVLACTVVRITTGEAYEQTILVVAPEPAGA